MPWGVCIQVNKSLIWLKHDAEPTYNLLQKHTIFLHTWPLTNKFFLSGLLLWYCSAMVSFALISSGWEYPISAPQGNHLYPPQNEQYVMWSDGWVNPSISLRWRFRPRMRSLRSSNLVFGHTYSTEGLPLSVNFLSGFRTLACYQLKVVFLCYLACQTQS